MEGKKIPGGNLEPKRFLQLVILFVILFHTFILYLGEISLLTCATGFVMHLVYYSLLFEFPNVVMTWPLLITLTGSF